MVDAKAVQVQDASRVPTITGHEMGGIHTAHCGTVAIPLEHGPGAIAWAARAQWIATQVAVTVGLLQCICVKASTHM